MAEQIPTQGDLYDAFRNEAQARSTKLTDWAEGSNLDALAGSTSVAGQQLITFIISRFAKTFFDTANGPAITGGPDDLQTLAVDHFGNAFARPQASKATVDLLFSRPNTDEGNVVILAGTIVKTEKDANGNEIRFVTLSDVTMTGLTIEATAEAIEGGSDGNVEANTLIVIETSLTDPSIEVTNDLAATGGAPVQDDPTYREFIRNQIETLRGATAAAIQAAARNVPGVVTATVIENLIDAIQYDVPNSQVEPGAESFKLPRGALYIADTNGTASQALLDDVIAATELVRACGVVVQVFAATPLTLNWIGSYSLNPGGPNFATLNSDPQLVIDTMTQYVRDLPIGIGFDRQLAKQFILSVWGPSGSNDLTDFVTNQPTGNITAATTDKLIPGTVDIV